MKILIADDEKLFRESMSVILPWEQYGFTLCEFAKNGEEAIRIALREKPDIILSDINMPKKNGLEFVAELIKKNSDAFIIIISGYDDFKYAKEAIDLGVYKYLLKPIDEVELSQALLEIKNIILSRRNQRKENLLLNKTLLSEKVKKLFQNGNFSEEINPSYHEKCIQLNKKSIAIVLVASEHDCSDLMYFAIQNVLLELTLNRYHLFFTYYNQKLCILMQDAEEELNINDIMSILNRTRIFFMKNYNLELLIGVGNIQNMVTKSNISYEEACSALHDRLIAPKDIYLYEKRDTDTRKSPFSLEKQIKLINHLKALQEEEACALLSVLFDESIEKKDSEELVLSIEKVTNVFQQFCNDYHIPLEMKKMDDSDDMDAILNSFQTYISRMILEIKKSSNERRVIQKIVRSIDRMYENPDLKVTDLAKQVYINENYLSTLFKKEMGISLSNYILRIRMEKAKELLDTENQSIKDVSLRVGILDSNYFTKCFRKVYGMTPTQYLLGSINEKE